MGLTLLSADFSLEEACKSQTALRCNIDNVPPADVVVRMATLAHAVLQPILEHYCHAPTISSFYRCDALNKAVGGVPDSQHCRGEAVDIEMTGLGNPDFALWISENLRFDQLILEFYTRGAPFSGWVHVSYIDERAPENVAVGRKNRNQVLTIGRGFTLPGLHP